MNPIKVFLSMFALGIVATIVAGAVGVLTSGDEGTGEVASADPEVLVQQSCIACHGSDLQGGMGGQAPSLIGMDLTKEEIVDILINGQGTMMPGGLVPGNEEAVAEYLLSLQ